MTKKQQQWITWFVVLTFMWLLQVSTVPLAADTTSEHVSAANAEQTPSFVERVKASGSPAKGKSILPYVLIGVGVIAVATILALVVFKTKYDYDIVGTWTIHIIYDDDGNPWDAITVFSGDKKSGTTLDNYDATGTYSVDGKKVTFTLSWSNTIMTFTGQFDGKDEMSGSFNEASKWTGTWTAVRGASNASVPKRRN